MERNTTGYIKFDEEAREKARQTREARCRTERETKEWKEAHV